MLDNTKTKMTKSAQRGGPLPSEEEARAKKKSVVLHDALTIKMIDDGFITGDQDPFFLIITNQQALCAI